MSALPIPPPYRAPFCRVNYSFFHHLLGIPNYAHLKCFALILVETIGSTGRGEDRYWSEIPDEMFVQNTGVSREWVLTALDELENNRQWIKSRKNSRGRREYSVEDRFIEEIEGAGKQKLKGRCTSCKEIGHFDTRFVKIPHAALRKLGACVGPAAFKCILAVLMHTADWKDGCWTVTPKELALEDFERLADLDSREITNGLTEAVEKGLIGRQLRKGKPSLFWAIPENFVNLERRPMRRVTPSEGGVVELAKSKPTGTAKTPANPEESSATESSPYFYGRCQACGHFVDVEPVTEEEFADRPVSKAVETVEKPPRAGPTRERKPKFILDLERRRREAIEDAEGIA